MYKRYTFDEVKAAVAVSNSFREATRKLRGVSHGGGSSHLAQLVRAWKIDCSHFHRIAWNKGGISTFRRSARNVLRRGRIEPAFRLRRALTEIGRPYACGICGISQWRGKAICLEIHHSNGDKTDNRARNLGYCCPNCHTQTPNYRFVGRSHRQDGRTDT